MKFKSLQRLFESKKITFIPVYDDGNGNWVDDLGVPVGHLIDSATDLRNEMDPFANGNADSRKINPNHYIPKADWDRASSDNSKRLKSADKEDDENSWSKNKGDLPPDEECAEDVWKNTGIIHYENDDETDEGYIYQMCVAPKESSNYGKGRWKKFNDAIY